MNPADIDALFAAQEAAWPDLHEGVRSLARVRSRMFEVRGVRVEARHIPHRLKSTTARVDDDSLSGRPCFLCARNLPPEQKGLRFDDDLTLLCNPFPILDRHLTVVHRDHVPQRIGADGLPGIGRMLSLARALPGFMVIYNGPRCGASAPDHMHFQVCSSGGVPAVEDIGRARGGVLPDYLRTVFVVSGREPSSVQSRFDRLMRLLFERHPVADEPMVNVVVLCNLGRWDVLVFPRVAHRPRVYDSGELLWSPGAIDMAGIVVLPAEHDLDRVGAPDIESVYGEVSLDRETAADIAGRLESQ